MAGKGAVFIQILGDSSGLSAATSKAEASLGKLGATTKETGAATSAFGSLSAKVWLGAAAATVGFAVVSIKAFEEHQVVLTELQHTIATMPQLVGASAAAFQKQATTLQNLTGITDEQILASDTILARFKLNAQQIQQLIPLVLDYSRATGQDASQSASLLGKALTGNARALKTVGIQFKATGDTTRDYNAIVDALRAKIGGVAVAFGGTLTGKIDIFKAKLNDLEVVSGQALLPALTSIVGALTKLIGPLQAIAPKLPIILAAFLGWKALTFIPPLLDAMAIGLIRIGAAADSSLIVSWGVAISRLSVGMGALLPEIAGLVALTAGSYKATVADAAHGTSLWAKATSALVGNIERASGIGNPYAKVVDRNADASGHAANASGTLANAVNSAADAMKAAKTATDQETNSVIANALATLDAADGFVGVDVAANNAKIAQLDYKDAVAKVNADLKANTDANKKNNVSQRQLTRDRLAASNAFDNAIVSQDGASQSIFNYAKQLVAAGGNQQDVIGKVREYARQANLSKQATNDLITKVKGLIAADKDVPPSVATKFTAPGLDSVAAAAAALENTLNNMNGRQVAVFIKTHHYARGTSSSAGGLALVGEQGPELVNLPAGSKVYTASQTRSMAGGGGAGGTTVIVNVAGSVQTERDLVECIRKGLNQVARRNGGRTGI